ncbi:hypothetical protein FRACYDRAFT_243876 [Fragilariopsis cylindrus CCMP1102]|uniref:Uncharacterized protein n=1 Tax=Fragilariopsis cylindrus CCMP1102 TaxID=635003 RepID=A0A1E7F368_9STRA|nr:hypothetical protein FRACYDRAFT_243876 [Fragilariopsis cylindrus CCMP1102]|eukprot:OEU12622.1 hypothetical protein FRACYDRAFT_243876 [Fragilariopsis cylindrus CCMP1102]
MTIVSAPSTLLTTDETFDESAIGSHISEGKKYLIEWRKKQTIAEVETITISDDDDDDDNDTAGKPTPSTSDDMSNGLAFLMTQETFPIKWLTEEEDLSADDSALVNNYTNSNTNISHDKPSRRNKRKSVVFQSNSSSNNKRWWKEGKAIQDLIPSNDSGIVGVMGRKIDMEHICENNSSVYSMLRAWVENDPSNTDRCNTPPPPPVDGSSSSSSSSSRKTISEYASMKPIPVSVSGGPARIEWSRSNNKSRAKASSPSLPAPFDLIQWLDTDPNLRMTIPYYPDEKQTRELAEKYRTKQAAKAARSLAKKRLKLKGIL